MWDEKIETIERDGQFVKIREIYRGINGWIWYATKKLDKTKRYGYVNGKWIPYDVKYMKALGLIHKVVRKNWYKDSRVKMVYESKVTRE